MCFYFIVSCLFYLVVLYYIVLYLESVSLNLDGDFDEGDFGDVVLCGGCLIKAMA